MKDKPLIKICGLWRREDIESANIADPDYIGFVFAESRRRVDIKTAADLKAGLKPHIKAAGVFVNETAEKIAEISSAEIIDIIQLHGDEDDAYIKRLKAGVKLPVIKAIPMGGKPRETREADFILLDTFDREKRGGIGRAFEWELAKKVTEKIKLPFFLAGGLNEANLAEAARIGPFCFDISSGAETDGLKEREKMIRLVQIVRGLQ
ncbi:MAG: phosphoribosylanthranilate isomerase [Deferribacteraceae bacterium]|jgi:phosphoribosylanthranilate isomerase|nr:phosphoribosylanthranilate isomerase [Deferribacteraceae bacterium]